MKISFFQDLFVQIIRTQHDTNNVRRQVDLAKLRLTTDIKVCGIWSFFHWDLFRSMSSYVIKRKMNVDY